jgi:hypothetical protein
MKAPFIYGKVVSGEDFTDREKELERLVVNFISGTNTILLSPRRWGKSSLILKAAEEAIARDPSLKVVFIDLFNIRSEADFYKILAEKVIMAVSDKIEQITVNVKKFMKQWIPRISFSPDTSHQVSFGLDWNELRKEPYEILDMAENIAISKGIQLIVCIDEFQNIAYYEDPLAFQKILRSSWQKHHHVTYCLFGSKRHMLLEVFSSPSMPFYKFGDLIFLEKIPANIWTPFIKNRFQKTGKSISLSEAEKIATTVDLHPYYVQQLAQICWLRSDRSTNDSIVDEAIDHLILQMSLLFQGITENLTTPQLNFLKALLDGITSYSSNETIRKYSLGSSSNVYRITKALIQKEIIDDYKEVIQFLDPVYALWLKHYYFKI